MIYLVSPPDTFPWYISAFYMYAGQANLLKTTSRSWMRNERSSHFGLPDWVMMTNRRLSTSRQSEWWRYGCVDVVPKKPVFKRGERWITQTPTWLLIYITHNPPKSILNCLLRRLQWNHRRRRAFQAEGKEWRPQGSQVSIKRERFGQKIPLWWTHHQGKNPAVQAREDFSTAWSSFLIPWTAQGFEEAGGWGLLLWATE